MPRKAHKLFKRDLDKMAKAAERDPAFTAQAADSDAPGLQAQARRGRLEFRFRYLSPVTNTRRAVTIGEYGVITLKQARDDARDYRRQVAAGVDPLDQKEEEERRSLTVREAVKLYLADLQHRAETGSGRRGKPGGYGAISGVLRRKVLPKLGKRQIQDLTVKDVIAWHRATTPPIQANRALTALSAVYGYLIKRGDLPPGANPTTYVDRHRETGQRRAISGEELERLGAVLAEAERAGYVEIPGKGGKTHRVTVHPSALLAIRLLALTGFRSGEVLGHGGKPRPGDKRQGLRWEDIDLDRQLVFLADSKTGRQTRVIGRAAVELLRAAKPADAEPDWCVCPGTLRKSKAFGGLGKVRARLWEAAGIETTPEGRADLHSLRHTYASVGAHLQSGRYAGAVSALLGHGAGVAQSITRRYIDEDPAALVPAADAIAEEIARRLGLTAPAKVLKHPATRKRRA